MPIQQGRYQASGDLLVNGLSTPWYDISVDINTYSFSSMIEAHGPIYALDGQKQPTSDLVAIDYGTLGQQGLVPITVRVGYANASYTQTPLPMIDLESGYIDETTDRYHANEIEFIARSTASIFQDSLIASAPSQYKNVRGDQLASMLFAKHGIPLVVGAPSPAQFIGKAYTEDEYVKAYRARSEWDEITDAALQDGYVCFIHNGQGYYGPPPVKPQQFNLAWGQDLVTCEVNHAPRRAHNIAVRVDSYKADTQTKVTQRWPLTSTGNETQTFRFFISGLDNNKARARAHAIWTDLVKHEFISRLSVRPDANFLRFIAQNGANWTYQLGGVRNSAALLYYCRQVTVKLEGGSNDAEPSLIVDIVGANYAPEQTGQT